MMAVGFTLFVLSWLGISIFSNGRNLKAVDYALVIAWLIGLVLMVFSVAVLLWNRLP